MISTELFGKEKFSKIQTEWLGKPPKKTGKKFTTVVNYRGGQQILVCEPQKSAFFRANFPKKTC